MTRKHIEKARAQLQGLASRLGSTVSNLEEQVRNPTGGEASGGLSNTPLHLADIGSESYSQELGATLLQNERYIRDEVAAALERMEKGQFGVCERCGLAILAERIDAIPYVRHCTGCAVALGAGHPST